MSLLIGKQMAKKQNLSVTKKLTQKATLQQHSRNCSSHQLLQRDSLRREHNSFYLVRWG